MIGSLKRSNMVIKKRQAYFSERFSQEHHVLLEKITLFFKNEFQSCLIGQADIKVVLPAYLAEWGWRGSVDEFLAYWFESEREIDVRITEGVRQLRRQGMRCYLVSDNEKERAAYLMNTVGLASSFDGAFFSYQLGTKKSSPEFFAKILRQLKVDSGHVWYWDDDEKNVEVAKRMGIDSHLYNDFEVFKNAIL